jgi:hypothetical protein
MKEPFVFPAEQEDWLKGQTWDIWWEGHLVNTLSDLRLALAGMGLTLSEFIRLPVAKALPKHIRDEMAAAGLRTP